MIPEYYKCIRGELESFTKGKIYKINNPKDLEDTENFIDDKGRNNGFCGQNYHHFTPSTLKEYNLQEGITTIIDKYDTLLEIMNKLNIE